MARLAAGGSDSGERGVQERIIAAIGVRAFDDYEMASEHSELAMAWLSVHLPDWRDPMAYWQ